jgi:hypothetical protein
MSRAHYRTGAIFSAVPIEPIRALMNRNSNPDAPRIISPEYGRNGPAPADGNFALTAGPGSAPGVTSDHWPVPPGELECPGGFLTGEVRAAAPPSGTPSREPQGCIDCSELAGGHGNLGRRSRRTARHLPPGRPESHSRLSSPFSGIPAVSVFPQAAGRLADGAAGRRDTGWRRGPGAQARAAPRHDRHGPNPRPLVQIRSNVPRGATRSSTARYFILHRIKVT